METLRIGVLGGSGLYNMEEFTDRTTYDIDTPFGKPSAPVTVGTLRDQRVAFIPRHGIGHHLTPGEVPYRANILALKLLGVTHVISVSACGSLQERYAPGHMVIPDQIVDLTRDRQRSFFGDGLVAHISVAEPFSPELCQLVYEAIKAVGATAHMGGTFITIEGPRFSTRGESLLYRRWGMDIIGMTTSPEAFLAREAEMHYAVIGHVTDYDSWHDEEEPVTVDMVIAILNRSVAMAQQAVAVTVERLGKDFSRCTNPMVDQALAAAFITNPDVIPPHTRQKLKPLISRYLG